MKNYVIIGASSGIAKQQPKKDPEKEISGRITRRGGKGSEGVNHL